MCLSGLLWTCSSVAHVLVVLSIRYCFAPSSASAHTQDDDISSDRVQGSVLEPCRIAVDMKMRGPTGDFSLSLSDLKLNLAPDILELVQSLQSSVLEPLVQPAPDRSVHGNTTACYCYRSCEEVVSPEFCPSDQALCEVRVYTLRMFLPKCLKPSLQMRACKIAGQWLNAPASVSCGQIALPMQTQLLPAAMPMCSAAREESPSGDLRLL